MIPESDSKTRSTKYNTIRYHKLLMDSPFAICVLKGTDLTIILANQLTKDFWGKGNDIVGQNLLELLPEMHDQPFPAMMRSVLLTGKSVKATEILAKLTHNGISRDYYYNVVYQPYYEDNDDVAGVTGIAYDVTEQVLARIKIEKSEVKYQNLVSSSTALICIAKGNNLVIEIANDAIIKSWGNGTEILGKRLGNVFPALVEQGLHKHFENVYETGKSFEASEMPINFIRYGKSELSYYNFVCQPIYDATNTISGISIIGSDVTPIAENNLRINASEQHFRTMADLLPAKISNADPDGNVTYFNQKWLDYTGLNFQDMKDFGYYKIIHPDDLQKFKDGFTHAHTTGTVLELNMRFLDLNGHYKWHLNLASPVKDNDGKVIMWVGSTTEIHDQITKKEDLKSAFQVRTDELETANEMLRFQNVEKAKREAELLIENEELSFQNVIKAKLAAELIIANEELIVQNHEKATKAAQLVVANQDLVIQNKEKAARTADLLAANNELLSYNYVISHHLQEPLRKIQMFSSIIAQSDVSNISEKGTLNLTRLAAAVARMRLLIEDLLRFSQTNSLQHSFTNEKLNILIDDVKTSFDSILIEKNAQVNLNCHCTASVIPVQFRQIIHNLFSNALKFAATNRQLKIDVTCEIKTGAQLKVDGLLPRLMYCHIMFADNGIGFDDKYYHKIFGVFQTLHHRNDYEGTGIGLAIVKKIVENHNGIITAKSQIDVGTTFNIYVPHV